MNKTLVNALMAGLLAALAACGSASPEAGKQKSAACQTCHGPDGNSTDPQFPRLAGQYEDYLVRALSDYQSGARKNPIMNGFAGGLSAQDIRDLAAFYSRQRAGVFDKR
jgi:cytochrome c553